MSRPGNCYDNAVAESFFATLEHELIAVHTWATHDAARQAIFAYIVEWYNRVRRLSATSVRPSTKPPRRWTNGQHKPCVRYVGASPPMVKEVNIRSKGQQVDVRCCVCR